MLCEDIGEPLNYVSRHEIKTDGLSQVSRVYGGRTALYTPQSTGLREMFELRVLVGSCRYYQVLSQSHCHRDETIPTACWS